MGLSSLTNSSRKAALLKPQFEVSKIADVNMDYLPDKDAKLAFNLPRDKCPFRYFRHEGGCGFIFSAYNTGDLQGDCEYIRAEVASVGFSGTLSALLCEARRQGIHWVRFDVDGAEIQNANRAQ